MSRQEARSAARALHPKPWKLYARHGAAVKVVSFASRERRDEAVSWYERIGYSVTKNETVKLRKENDPDA